MRQAGKRQAGRLPMLPIAFGYTAVGIISWLCCGGGYALAASPGTDAPAGPVRLDPVVVSAGRVEQTLQDVPANVTVLSRDDIERSPARTVDDLLRQIPGFSLFRRSSSLVANPTTQGVSLRGIGPSGVSRTLVLLDGVPLNDPFGGWVYWSKVPLESIERIKVVRGGGSASQLRSADARPGRAVLSAISSRMIATPMSLTASLSSI